MLSLMSSCVSKGATDKEKSLDSFLSNVSAEKVNRTYSANTLLHMMRDEEYRDCFVSMFSSNEGEVFFTLTPEGTFSNVAWFPPEANVICFTQFLSETTITNPKLLPAEKLNLHHQLFQPVISIKWNITSSQNSLRQQAGCAGRRTMCCTHCKGVKAHQIQLSLETLNNEIGLLRSRNKQYGRSD